jgi:hypothetical protein
MVPNEYKEYYNLILYYDSPFTLTLVRRSNDSWSKKYERIRNSLDCIFFRKNLPVSVIFGIKFKSELGKYNFLMGKNHIEINN